MDYKKNIEDFVVNELIDLNCSGGKYLYVKVVKKNWNTLDVVKEVCKRLKLKRSSIGFAGNKDKRAVTTQYFSLYNVKEISRLRLRDVEFSKIGFGSKPISLGDLKGNKFKIKLGYIPHKVDFVCNYFGEQRFGGNNVEIGLCLLKKDFKKIVELLSLKVVANDYIGAIKELDKKMISLYINSVQSLIWNNVVVKYLKINYINYKEKDGLVFVSSVKKRFKLPLIGFDTEFNPEVEDLYKEEMDKLGLNLKDFITRSFPECIPVNVDRDVFVDVKDFKYSNGYVEFVLGKGSYATVVLKKLETYLS